MKTVTLIGSRETPDYVLAVMMSYVKSENAKSTIFRSGGADGADSVVTKYAKFKEIYIPWDGFSELHEEHSERTNITIVKMDDIHRRLVEKYHPNPKALTEGGYKLMARNLHQITGTSLNKDNLTDRVVCWTKNGKEVGGTAFAIRIARALDIPVYNLGNHLVFERFKEKYGTIRKGAK